MFLGSNCIFQVLVVLQVAFNGRLQDAGFHLVIEPLTIHVCKQASPMRVHGGIPSGHALSFLRVHGGIAPWHALSFTRVHGVSNRDDVGDRRRSQIAEALSQLGGATETMFDDFDHADLVSLAKRYGIKRDGVQPLR